MAPPDASQSRPRRLLLATGLGSRSDRAFERAVRLAREWDAELHLLHAVESPAPVVPAGVDAGTWQPRHADPRRDAVRELRSLADECGVATTLHVEDGLPAPAILDVAEREACDLLVLGEARERVVGPLENTIEQVVRKSPASVLLVRNRATRPYARLLVGTDLTGEAQQALEYSANVFADAEIVLMHAYSMPYAGLLGAPDDRGWLSGQEQQLRAQRDAAAIPPARRQAIRLRVEPGAPATVLRDAILAESADLAVIGAHPRGMLFDAVVGSTRSIVDSIPGDLLVVRAVRREAA